ncbi:MAG: DNA repair protein RecO [Chitinispirillaceae bacterium]|nr:DNA repair protein RecO [Chitinispirillaceae bacterium]
METCSCIVLSVMPWRESSYITTLFSRTLGRVGGIAKGVRRSPSQAMMLERGQIIDCVLYYRPHRELHTMSQIAVDSFFEATRSDLGKLAVRDTALEIILKSLGAAEFHPELFDYTSSFLSQIEDAPKGPMPFPVLWRFIAGWSALSGFKINLRECFRCGSDRILDEGGRLSPEHDGIVCKRCLGADGHGRSFIPAAVLQLLTANAGTPAALPASAAAEELRITNLLADYARYHFDIRGELKTVSFLESIVTMQKLEGMGCKAALRPLLTP